MPATVLILNVIFLLSALLLLVCFFTYRFTVFARVKTRKAGLLTGGAIALVGLSLSGLALAILLASDSPALQAAQKTAASIARTSPPKPQGTAKPQYLYSQALQGKDAELEAQVRARLRNCNADGAKANPFGEFAMERTDRPDIIYAKYRILKAPLGPLPVTPPPGTGKHAAQDESLRVASIMLSEMGALGIRGSKITVYLKLYAMEADAAGQNKVHVYGYWKESPPFYRLVWIPPAEKLKR